MYFCFLVGDVFIFVILCKFKAFKLQFAIKKRKLHTWNFECLLHIDYILVYSVAIVQ